MASSAITELDVNLSDNSIEVCVEKPITGVWSLDCDIIVEDMDAVVQKTKVNDIVLAGNVLNEQLSVDIDYSKETSLELDVSVSVNGVSSSIAESQVVSYDRILQINENSPETTNEKKYASSAFATKKLHDLLSDLDTKVENLEHGGGGTHPPTSGTVTGVQINGETYYPEHGIVTLPSYTVTSATYIHTQGVADSVWTIMHTMNKYPSVTVVDSAGSVVHGEVTYNSTSVLTVRFTAAFSGKAYLN